MVIRALSLVGVVQVVSVTVWLVPLVRAVWLLCQGSVALVTVTVVRWGLVPVVVSDGEGAGDAGWLHVVGFSPRHSWWRVPLVLLVVRLVDVVVLLRSFVLLGWWGPLVDVDDAPGDVDAVGVTVFAVADSTPGWGPDGWRWWRLFASRAGVLGDAVTGGALGVTLCRGRGGGGRGVVGDGTSAHCWCGWWWCGYCRGCWRRWCCQR